jgi:hypothetical protein
MLNYGKKSLQKSVYPLHNLSTIYRLLAVSCIFKHLSETSYKWLSFFLILTFERRKFCMAVSPQFSFTDPPVIQVQSI